MEQIVLNRLMEDGMREVKLLSDRPVELVRMYRFVATNALDHAEVRVYDTAALSLFYGEARWPARDAVDFHLPHWRKFRRLVVWRMLAGDRVSVSMEEARLFYFQLFMRHPRFAFVRRVPRFLPHPTSPPTPLLKERGDGERQGRYEKK